ncbi:MAG: autotransporter-associated beta strand repeat-containing protein [Planctomycetota bacterium]|nr:autotransporter-associated beta strand repeat-containing protein [Planctomycetota bacterium]
MAAALGLLAASPALGLVQHPNISGYMNSEGPPDASLMPPAGVVGWFADNASAVAIAPDLIITTRHQGYRSVGVGVNFGGDYTVYDWFVHPVADIRIGRIRTFPGGQPAALTDTVGLYTATDEVNQTATIGGFGKQRGATYPDYYTWAGLNNQTRSWGRNKFETTQAGQTYTSFFGETYTCNFLVSYFDDYGAAGRVPYEAAVADWDSGGGWFLQSGGVWKLAGLTMGAHQPPESPGNRSYFRGMPTPSGGSAQDAIRISAYDEWITGVLTRSTWSSAMGGAWSDTVNWDNGSAPAAKDKWAVFSDSTPAARGVTVGANTKLGTLRFDTPGDVSISKTDSGGLEFSVTIDSAVLETFSANGNGALVISAPVKLTSPLLVNHNSAGLVTLSGQVSGTKGLTKSGTGTLVLAASNTFTGGTLVNQGTLRLTSAGALGLLGKTTTLGGGDLEVRSDSSLTYTNGVKATASATINVDRASSGTGQTMTFGALTTENQVTLHVTGGNGYSLAFSGTALIDGLSGTGIATIDTAGADLKLLGGLTLNQGTLAKTGPGTLTVAGTQTYGPNTTLKVNQGTLALKTDVGAVNPYALAVNVSGTGAAANFGSSQHLAGLTIGASGQAAVAAGGSRTLSTRMLNITGGAEPTGRLDLADNFLVVSYTGSSPLAQIADLVRSGFADLAWNGNGISSSAAAADPGTYAVGFAEYSVIKPLLVTPFGPGNPFGTEADIDDTTVLVRYTLVGDVNLDGIVDDIDIGILTGNYLSPGTWGWADGDVFGYDGIIDDNDVGLQAGNYLSTASAAFSRDAMVLTGLGLDYAVAGGAEGTSAGFVPEPATLGLIAAGVFGLALRRRLL